MKILGISASLRNARFGLGSDELIKEVKNIGSEAELYGYLETQTKIRADDFIAAGRRDNQPFDIIYRNLQKAKGDKGLSNSEAALVAGLWSAHQQGADIAHSGLAAYFPMNGQARDLDQLKAKILDADAFLISGPVYFGDRSSLAQELIEFMHADEDIRKHVQGRCYAGLAVGAKRNGGQETTLIYQIVDMANLNMLVVGNSAETTSQYGGTVHAGDVGTAYKDEYGITTSIGTGSHLARTALGLERAKNRKLRDKTKIAIWVVQDDKQKSGVQYIESILAEVHNDDVEFDVIDLSAEEVYRCIACDVCPISIGEKEEYRCIIKSSDDFFVKQHERIVQADAILIAAYSPIDKKNTESVYQKFMERTRYLRRDDYVFTDRLVAPLVISEINSNQNLHIRILTSLVRHNTILHHPVLGFEQDGEIINRDFMVRQAKLFAEKAVQTTISRLLLDSEESSKISYNPVGYTISMEQKKEDAAEKETIEKARAKKMRAEQERVVALS